MAPPTAIPQEKLFYNDHWTKDVDVFFIDALMDEAMKENYSLGSNNLDALRAMMIVLNKHFETSFDLRSCSLRYRKLMHRYMTFKWLIHLNAVTHSPYSWKVQCSEDAYEFLCEKEPMAKACMITGEEKFDALKCLIQEKPDSPDGQSITMVEEVIEKSIDHDALDPKEKYEEHDGIGKEGEPDNGWWDDILMDSPGPS